MHIIIVFSLVALVAVLATVSAILAVRTDGYHRVPVRSPR